MIMLITMTEHSLEETGNKVVTPSCRSNRPIFTVEQASSESCCSATASMASEMDLTSTVLLAGAVSLAFQM